MTASIALTHDRRRSLLGCDECGAAPVLPGGNAREIP